MGDRWREESGTMGFRVATRGLVDDLERLDALRQSGALTAEEFGAAKAHVLRGKGPGGVPGADLLNRFARSSTDRMLGGVCGGLGRATGLPGWAFRLAFVLATVFFGVGVVVYVAAWAVVPSDEKPGP